MIRGLWISAGAMTPASRAQEILANNLANAVTGGFRQDRLTFHRGPGADAAAVTGSPMVDARIDLAPGALETTGDRFHLAIDGPGFFVVEGPEGELYTRDGAMRRAADGTVLHRTGHALATEGGALVLPPGAEFAVASDGTVFADGTPVAKLRIVALAEGPGLRHAGTGLLQTDEAPAEDTTSRVLQGSLEGANVDPILSTMAMSAILRGYEANQRAILAQDASLGRLIQWANG